VVVVLGLTVLPAAIVAQLPSSEATQNGATSHVRVVRLSYVSGNVTVKRPGSSEGEKALVNTPLQEGFGIATSDASYAEVEFENGSTARLGELSSLTFSQLALDAQGDKLNRLTFEQGYATFHFLPEHQDIYSVTVADATLTPEGKSEFRTDFIQGYLRLEVFFGTVHVATPSKSAKVAQDKTLEYTPGAAEVTFQIRNGIVTDDWDKWTEARDTQAQLALRDESVKTQRGLYGWSDLDAYGEWAEIPGSGYGWAPYAQAGWSPFSAGMWNWYPALGWTWISSEPWGWLPYHCGLWDYDFALGWFWMPMGGCGFWNPALVSWFRGPGWVGWCPRGRRGHPGGGRPSPIHPGPRPLPGFEHLGTNYVTKVPTSVFQGRQMITPQMVSHVEPGEEASMQHAPPGPSAPAMRSAGSATSGRNSFNSAAAVPTGARPPATTGNAGPGAGMRISSAPPTILMGGSEAVEGALFQMHEGGSSNQPLRLVMGPTLGGQFVMLTNVGEFRGGAFGGPLSYGWSGAVVMPHGHRSSPRMEADGLVSAGHWWHFGRARGYSGAGLRGGHVGGGHAGSHLSGGHGGGHLGGSGHSGGGGGHR
jgi:hypothetical protein